MQTSVPELTDTSEESEHVFESYGEDSRTPGTFAANCLLARRLSERGVRFVQLFHRGWDQHTNLPRDIRTQCNRPISPAAALINDLNQRGMLDDTLVVWGGEFGRTVYCQGPLTAGELWPRSPSAMFYDLDGRCGCEKWIFARNDRRL